ncbi:TrkH family potassium uptake protein [Botrimarina hoheduenensis]|uniref:Ktr system potassium uptake protein B n=1 Tax=Botrimarina hoheduenensis TaxID=2528000 RepID=A0A5C5W8J5_9BACT|nr:potassium transporter TrkG [Botrimarina hoheduenensis]TWT46924.1 Ktr system potassium uptake protein B [Botrimarina hoheduenensis]
MPQFVGSINRYPGRASLSWYGGLIALGFLLLYFMPACAADPDRPISPLDALFTSTSASCVTGLVVRSTVADFSTIGQAVILLLIQLGGVGIMTVTTFIVVQFDKRGSLRQRKAIADTLGGDGQGDMRRILTSVLTMTAVCEAVGFLILTGYNLANYHRFMELGVWQSRLEAIWHALFHSVSAFCNAGFALHDASLTPFADSWIVNGTISLLIVIGGLGFPVVLDLWRARKRHKQDRWSGLQLHSKIMLIGTGVLLLVGFFSFLLLERDGVLGGAPIGERIVKAAMHSASCRTAGFNSVEMRDLSSATLFVTILLMMIGAGPCSTGGGFKVTTAAIIGLRAWATFQGYTRVNLFRRTLSPTSIERAVATAMLFLVLAGMAVTTLLVIEQATFGLRSEQGLFLDVLFEVISALGTVGLSTGITTQLSDASRLVVVLLMLLGRLGPITTFVALSHSQRSEPVEFPTDEPLVG